MIVFPTPSSSWAEHKVSLAGKTYSFVFKFNSYQQRWMLDIYLDGIPVILGQMIVENFNLFYGKPIKNFDHGILATVRNFEGKSKLSRDNFGIDKEFSLLYLSNEEWENAGNYQ